MRGASTRLTWMSRSALAPDADGEDRQRRCALSASERLRQRRSGRVGAVADDDEPGERQPGQLVARAVERRAEPRVPCRRTRDRRRGAAGRADERSEDAHPKRSASAWSSGAIRGAELLLHEVGARLAVGVGDPHAARVVDQHADEVLLRHGGAEHQQRDGTGRTAAVRPGRAQAGQHQPVASGEAARRPAVAMTAAATRPGRRAGRTTPRRRGEAQFALAEDDPADAEKELREPSSTSRIARLARGPCL